MIFLAIAAVIAIIVLSLIYYRTEKGNVPNTTIRRNILGIVVLVIIIAWCLKAFFIHDSGASGPPDPLKDPAYQNEQTQ